MFSKGGSWNTAKYWRIPAAVSLILVVISATVTVSPGVLRYVGSGHLDISLYYASLSMIVAGLLVMSLVLRYEYTFHGPKEVAVIGALSALSAASRLVIPIPNVKPCTFLIIVTGYVFGPDAGIMIGILTPAVSNMFLGQGYWTFWQMLMWAIAGWSGSLLRKRFPNISIEALAAYAFIWGFLFGTPLDFATWLSLNANVSILPAIMVAGVPWNLLDGIGNLLFVLLAGRYTISILERYKRRFEIHYLDSEAQKEYLSIR